MGQTPLSRTAAIVIMTSALAWNLPVLAQEDDADDAVRVTAVSDEALPEAQERDDEVLRAEPRVVRHGGR